MGDRILHEVGEHSLDERLVGAEHRRVVSDLGVRRGLLLAKAQFPVEHHFGEQSGGRDRFRLQRERLLFHARHVEEVLDEPEEVLGLSLHVREGPCRSVVDRAEVAVAKHLERREHRGERGLQVVHDHPHQVVARLLQFAQPLEALLERIGGTLELEQTADARAKHVTVVRLQEEVIPTGLDRLQPVRRVVERRDEDHRDPRGPRVSLEPTADLEPGLPRLDTEVARRHRDVEDADVRMVLRASRERRRTIHGVDHTAAERGQLVAQQFDVRLHIVRDQHQCSGGSGANDRRGHGAHRDALRA